MRLRFLAPVCVMCRLTALLWACLVLQLLREVGVHTDLLPVGREVAGVVLQGKTQNLVSLQLCERCLLHLLPLGSTVGPKVTFFQPEDEVVGEKPDSNKNLLTLKFRAGQKLRTLPVCHSELITTAEPCFILSECES